MPVLDVPDPLPLEGQPWDRQLGESVEQHALFQLWLEGSTAIGKELAESTGVDVRVLRAIAIQHRWAERRHAYACALRHLERQTVARFVQNQTSELQELFQGMHELMSRSVAACLASGKVVHPREMAALARALVEGLRLLKGESTSNANLNLSGTPDDVLRQMREAALGLVDGAGGAAGGDAIEDGN